MRLKLAGLIFIATAAHAATPAAHAQQQQGQGGSVTSAFSGFSTKSNDPVNVEADNLEVRDQDQSAIFSGNVVLKQGESVLNARKLTIYYYQKGEGPKSGGQDAPKQGETAGGQAAKPESGRQIKRMVAEGDVVVTQRNQRATGAKGVFDVESNKAEMTGGVVVSQDDNVIKGDRLKVDLTTQVSRVEGGGGGGSRVQGVFTPKQQPGR